MLPTLRTDNDKRPRFEYYPADSDSLRTVFVEQTPFTIGRGEESSLQIHCSSVSRIHAEVSHTAGGYRLRDLRSTNGTTINGLPVEETILQDGDAVTIADIEMTFVCSSLGQLQRMVTQPLALEQRPAYDAERSPASLPPCRTLNEALLWQAIPISRQLIVDTRSHDTVATIASIDHSIADALHASRADDPCSAAHRLQDLAWLQAAEHAAVEAPPGSVTLLRIEQAARMGDAALAAFRRAQAGCPQRLGVQLPWDWVTSEPRARTPCGKLAEQGAAVALEGFSGGAQCIENLQPLPTEFLVLAPAVVREVTSHPRRRHRLEIIQESCETWGIRIVLPDAICEEDQTACHALGIHLRVCDSTTAAPVGQSASLALV